MHVRSPPLTPGQRDVALARDPDPAADRAYFRAATARGIVTTTEWKYAAASSEYNPTSPFE